MSGLLPFASASGDPVLQYHLAELSTASDPSSLKHVLPPRARPGQRILDIGCGAGQTLITAFPDSDSVGLDVDIRALRLGNALEGATRARFVCGRAEMLPFPDKYFDLVVARVSLPYADLRLSLSEVHRVLKTGGRVWMTLHPLSFYWRQALRTNYRGWLFFAFIFVNTLVFHVSGRQFRMRGRCDSFQTEFGISRALKRYGFKKISIDRSSAFLVTAEACA